MNQDETSGNNINNTINQQRIESLRNLIQERPRNGRAMAQLAYLLHEMDKYNINNDDNKEEVNDIRTERNENDNYDNDDTITWAKRSITIAPNKPYGYIAMSFILPIDRITERIENIHKALEQCCCTDKDHNPSYYHNNMIMKFHLLVRLLIEPREDEKRYILRIKKLQQSNHNTNNNVIHPSTRPFSINEENTYQQMITMYESYILNINNKNKNSDNVNDSCSCNVIKIVETDTNHHHIMSQNNNNNIGTIAYDEYRLGLLFRKMKNENINNTSGNMYQKRSIYWFQNSIRHFDIILFQEHSLATTTTTTSPLQHEQQQEQLIMINNKSFSYYYSMAQFWLETLTSSSNNKYGTEPSITNTRPDEQYDDDHHLNPIMTTSRTATNKMITKCPPEYIINLYSTFAERFDELLVKELQYQTPTILCQLVNECYPHHDPNSITSNLSTVHKNNLTAISLDIGCGTGVSGIEFYNHCIFIHDYMKQIVLNDNNNNIKCMIGVDLSSHMIEKAKQRKCYNELYIGDATSVLSSLSSVVSSDDEHVDNNIDDTSSIKLETGNDDIKNNANSHDNMNHFLYTIVFACDVFVYIGDLNEMIQRVYDSLIPGGIFAFSTELLLLSQTNDDIKSSSSTSSMLPPPYILHSCARFAHSEHYIRTISIHHGFIILKSKICSIRKNQGKDVIGYLIVLQKPAQIVIDT